MAIYDFLDHRYEDRILLPQLGDERRERLHGDGSQLAAVFNAADQRLNDARGEIAQVQAVADEIDRF